MSGGLPVIGGFLPQPPGGPRDRPSRGGRRERGLMGGGPGDEGSWPWSDSSQRWPRLHHPQPPSRVTDDRPERARGPSTRLPPDLLLPPPALSRAGRFCRTEGTVPDSGWRERSPTPGMTDSGGHEAPAPDGRSWGPGAAALTTPWPWAPGFGTGRGQTPAAGQHCDSHAGPPAAPPPAFPSSLQPRRDPSVPLPLPPTAGVLRTCGHLLQPHLSPRLNGPPRPREMSFSPRTRGDELLPRRHPGPRLSDVS